MAMQLLGKGADAGSVGLPQKRPLATTNAPVKDPEQDAFDKLLDDAKKAKADTLLNFCSFCNLLPFYLQDHWKSLGHMSLNITDHLLVNCDKEENAIKAKLRRLCEEKKDGSLKVPQWLHDEWKTGKDHLRMARQFRSCNFDKVTTGVSQSLAKHLNLFQKDGARIAHCSDIPSL